MPPKRCRARSVGRACHRTALLAITLAMLGVAIYIWFRFEWQFGVGALVTLAHDVALIARLLRADPASGRSQHRRRLPRGGRLFAQRHGRHLRPDPRKHAQVPQDADRAAAQPVAERDPVADHRHLGLDHAVALAILLLFGPDVIFGLTAAILLGTFIGTYSSIYISAPILVWLGVKPDSFLKVEDKAAKVAGRRRRGGVSRGSAATRSQSAWPATPTALERHPC